MAYSFTWIFNDTARALLSLDAPDATLRNVLGNMIETFLEGGWSNAAESLAAYRDNMLIVGLFQENDITIPCGEQHPNVAGECRRNLAHSGDHVDQHDYCWPRKGDRRKHPEEFRRFLTSRRNALDRDEDPEWGVLDSLVDDFDATFAGRS